MSKHFVLVHGAWHGGWVYDEAIKLLEVAGHTAEAPTYPGNSPGDGFKREIDMESCSCVFVDGLEHYEIQ